MVQIASSGLGSLLQTATKTRATYSEVRCAPLRPLNMFLGLGSRYLAVKAASCKPSDAAVDKKDLNVTLAREDKQEEKTDKDKVKRVTKIKKEKKDKVDIPKWQARLARRNNIWKRQMNKLDDGQRLSMSKIAQCVHATSRALSKICCHHNLKKGGVVISGWQEPSRDMRMSGGH